jgi:hypothetical protein
VRRERAVEIDFAQLQPPEGATEKAGQGIDRHLQVELFEDVNFEVVLDRIERPSGRESRVWQGRIVGLQDSEVILVVGRGMVMANFATGDGRFYQIRSQGKTQVVREIDKSRFRPEQDIPVFLAEPSATTRQASADDGGTVDVMVVYTPSVVSVMGSVAAVENLIDLGVAETNQGYTNSGIVQRLRLVHTAQVNYNENTASPYNDALNAVTFTDGKIDEVQTLRNTYGADLVSLWINNGQYCGLGWQMGSPSSAFEAYGYNVVAYNCATGNYSFGHEMGHNMGSNHDQANSGGISGSYSYSYGWRDPNNAFRTVLAYNCSVSCPRINYYSNPSVFYNGRATGSSTANNAQSLNNTRTIVANFRPAVSMPTVSGFSPTSGYPSQSVTISGSGLAGTTAVQFNGTPTTFTALSDGQLSAVIPTGATSGQIAVSNALGTTTSATSFTVTPAPSPAVGLALSPSSRSVGAGSTASYTVAINRTNFTGPVTLSVSGTPSGAAATFSPNPATGTSATLNVSTVSSTAPGTSTLSITGSASGLSIAPVTATLTVTAPAPSISSFSPNNGPVGTTVTITGTNFTGTTAVRFNGTTAAFSVVSATQIRATVPSGATTGNLQVTSPSGTATSSQRFRVR